MSIQIGSPAVRIKYIQAAKEGKLDVIKKFVEEGVPIDTTDIFFENTKFFSQKLCLNFNNGLYLFKTVYCSSLGFCIWTT